MSKVFVRSRHDSAEHREKVLAFSERRRADGIETLLEQYVNGSPPEGWLRWMLDQLDGRQRRRGAMAAGQSNQHAAADDAVLGRSGDWSGRANGSPASRETNQDW